MFAFFAFLLGFSRKAKNKKQKSKKEKQKSKTPKSKSVFCAGYYIVYFEKVKWRKAYCPKVITLQRYPYKGPMKSKVEMQQVLNNAVKEFQNTNPSN